MTPEEVRAVPLRVLSEAERESYLTQGYILLPGIIPGDVIDRLQAVVAEMVDRSRSLRQPDAMFELEADHTAENPRLRRLSSPQEHHPYFWEFATGLVADVAADLIGPNVKFHHGKLNFKWQAGGAEVKWHQDIQGWPHTNYSPLTIGAYLDDVDLDQGPLAVLPSSHEGELCDIYDDAGKFVGSSAQAERLAAGRGEEVVYLTGPRGSLTVHNCRTLHASKTNQSPRGRPLLLNVFSAADAFTYTANSLPSSQAGAIVRGSRATWARHDPRPCPVPPERTGLFRPAIFADTPAAGGM